MRHFSRIDAGVRLVLKSRRKRSEMLRKLSPKSRTCMCESQSVSGHLVKISTPRPTPCKDIPTVRISGAGPPGRTNERHAPTRRAWLPRPGSRAFANPPQEFFQIAPRAALSLHPRSPPQTCQTALSISTSMRSGAPSCWQPRWSLACHWPRCLHVPGLRREPARPGLPTNQVLTCPLRRRRRHAKL